MVENMRGMTPKVAMLADVFESHSATSKCLPMCDWALMTMSLHHSIWMYLTLIGQ